MPMGGRRLYCHADETAPGAPNPADPKARVQELFGSFAAPVPAILDAMEKVQVARTDEVVLESWSRGPVLLVGDAAHATAPTLAQGAAMAFEDAVVLGEVLRASPDDIAAASGPGNATAPAMCPRRCATRCCGGAGSGSSRTSTGGWFRHCEGSMIFGHPPPGRGRRGTILPARYAFATDVSSGTNETPEAFRDDPRA